MNEVRLSDVSENSFVAFDAIGPDVIFISPVWKKQSDKLTLANDPCPMILTVLKPFTEYRTIYGLMKVLLKGKIQLPRKLLQNKGTWIVVIECSMSCLKEHQGLEGFLIPNQNHNNFKQKYARIKKRSFTLLHHQQPVDEFDEVLRNETVGDLEFRSFKLSDYDVGLMFLYCENDGLSRPKVTSKYSINTYFDHKMLNGTVISHRHRNTNLIRLKNKYLVTLGKVYPTRGFGSHSSAKSEGVNVYTGIKSSSLAIGNPFTEPYLVPFQKLWSSTGDMTYNPVIKTFINAFTSESSNVMCACTSLLHCFIEEVFRKTYKMSSVQFLNLRGYNSLSILTSGYHLTKTDGF